MSRSRIAKATPRVGLVRNAQSTVWGFSALLAALLFAAALVACSDSSKKATTAAPTISVAFSTTSAPPTSLLTSATAEFAAVVTNDSFNDGVTWAVTCSANGTDACGIFNGPGSGSDINIKYTAPAVAPTPATVTVTATSVTDTSKSISATINITSPISVGTINTGGATGLLVNATLSLSVVVSNDPKNQGVTWSCLPAGTCGTFNPATTASGATTTYTAPATIPADNGMVTLIATSVTDTTMSSVASITVGVISVIFNPSLPGSIAPGATASFAAVVSNDSANRGITWAVTCGSAGACGTLSVTTTASGSPTMYTAPAAAPAGGTVMVTATSVTDPTKSAQASIVIGVPSLADGTYVFALSGLQNPTGQPYFVAGVFVVSGGAITGGEQDYHGNPQPPTFSGIATDLISSSGGDIATSVDGNVTITLATCNGTDCTSADANVGVKGVETLDASAVSPTRLLVTEFDKSATASGTVDLQTSAAAPSQGYAFEIQGIDLNAFPVTIGGIVNVDSPGTISGTGSVFDINDGAYEDNGFTYELSNQPFAASTVSAPDSSGRVVFNLVPAGSKPAPFSLAGYIIDSTHMKLVETSDALGAVMGGIALGQGTNTGNFATLFVPGTSFVFSAGGKDTTNNFTNAVFQAAGVLTANTDGTVSGTLNYNDLNEISPQSPIAFTGTYTLDPTGRMTLTNLTDGGGVFTFPSWEYYLTGSGAGTVGTMVSMDPTDVLSGLCFQQTGSPFSASSFSGTYVMNATGADPQSEAELDAVGPVTAGSSGSFAGTVDLNWLFHTGAAPDLTVSGTFTASSSGAFTGTITGLDVNSPTNNDAFTYYIIDTTKVVAIETDSNQLTLVYFEIQQ